jgi:hypothetical protein
MGYNPDMADESKEAHVDFPDYPPMDETGMVDLWQIEANLALTPAQRIKKFLGFLKLQSAMRRGGMKYYGNLPSSDSPTS